MSNKTDEFETKVQTHLDNAIDAEREKDFSRANWLFRFAAFYEGKLLGVESAKDYATSCGDPYTSK